MNLADRIRALANIEASMEDQMKDRVVARTVREIDSGVMYLGIQDEIYAIADEVEKYLFQPASVTIPGHDLPVAWPAGTFKGMPVLACPHLESVSSAVLLAGPSTLQAGVVVLDSEPGRL